MRRHCLPLPRPPSAGAGPSATKCSTCTDPWGQDWSLASQPRVGPRGSSSEHSPCRVPTSAAITAHASAGCLGRPGASSRAWECRDGTRHFSDPPRAADKAYLRVRRVRGPRGVAEVGGTPSVGHVAGLPCHLHASRRGSGCNRKRGLFTRARAPSPASLCELRSGCPGGDSPTSPCSEEAGPGLHTPRDSVPHCAPLTRVLGSSPPEAETQGPAGTGQLVVPGPAGRSPRSPVRQAPALLLPQPLGSCPAGPPAPPFRKQVQQERDGVRRGQEPHTRVPAGPWKASPWVLLSVLQTCGRAKGPSEAAAPNPQDWLPHESRARGQRPRQLRQLGLAERHCMPSREPGPL